MSKASRERAHEKYEAWLTAKHPEATPEERRAIHDAHKAAMVPWRERRERYEALPAEPLRIVAEIAGPVVAYDPAYLEGLLAWAVVMDETNGRGVDAPPRYTPLPLEAAGFYGQNNSLPLWRASVFAPVGESVRDVSYVHKRAPQARHSNYANIKTIYGRYMDRRVPLPTVTARAWDAFCYGNAAEVERLLSLCSHLGKRRGSGYGEVHKWWVVPWEGGDPLMGEDGRLRHAIPEEHAVRANYRIDEPPVLVGWTPPHWAPGTWSMGWPVGAPVSRRESIDFFAAAPG